ncbi:E3 SUMO-protein ligase ZBED1-like [Misgurnus anguillicaudatus]|uniref:E3 SUMO-protein ligase ZBED1-like n=1 Tax=Misgurnus anguillicaudatus TaxID=75329 RepID=UPI003CCF9F5C
MEYAQKRTRSQVWKHFSLNSPTQVVCGICDQTLSFSNNTSSMLRHLRAKHPLTVAEDNPTSETQRKSELDNALLNMIVKDLQPFSIVEDEGFRAYVKKLDPTYTLPSRKTLKAMMNMWTSRTMDSYFGVTCHYTDANTHLGSVLLGVAKFPKAHTTDNIKEALSHLISDWSLTGMVTTIVTDNAANMIAATEKLGLCHLPCFAHTLNLIVKKAVKEHEALTDIRTRARRVVTYFRSSAKANDKLILAQERMGKQPLQLVQEVETRWNSTHDMLQRLLDLQEPVGAALASLSIGMIFLNLATHRLTQLCITRWNSVCEMFDRPVEQWWVVVVAVLSDRTMTELQNDRILELKDEYWQLMEDTQTVLSALKFATTVMSAEKDVSISNTYPVTFCLIKSTSCTVKETGPDSSNSRQKCVPLSSNEFCVIRPKISSMLDPPHKHLGFLTPRQRLAANVKLVELEEAMGTDRSAIQKAGGVEAALSDMDNGSADTEVTTSSHLLWHNSLGITIPLNVRLASKQNLRTF